MWQRILCSMAASLASAAFCVEGRCGTTALDDAMRRAVAAATDVDSITRAHALWPVKLDAPLLLHDPAVGESRHWSPESGKIVAAVLPKGQPIANICIDFDDRPTAMIVLPLPETEIEVATLVWRERWHCAQGALGLASRETKD